jgi:hypothetical protein
MPSATGTVLVVGLEGLVVQLAKAEVDGLGVGPLALSDEEIGGRKNKPIINKLKHSGDSFWQ